MRSDARRREIKVYFNFSNLPNFDFWQLLELFISVCYNDPKNFVSNLLKIDWVEDFMDLINKFPNETIKRKKFYMQWFRYKTYYKKMHLSITYILIEFEWNKIRVHGTTQIQIRIFWEWKEPVIQTYIHLSTIQSNANDTLPVSKTSHLAWMWFHWAQPHSCQMNPNKYISCMPLM